MVVRTGRNSVNCSCICIWPQGREKEDPSSVHVHRSRVAGKRLRSGDEAQPIDTQAMLLGHQVYRCSARGCGTTHLTKR